MVLKLIGPIFWGLSLVTACSIVMYYVFGKDEEEEENKKVKTSRINVIEVSVPKSIVPALIGRGGSNIKEIEKTTGAKVNVKEFTDKDHDVCVIRGRSDATQIAETLIHDFINQQPLNVEDSIDVPAWACGRIIGTQGENITSISHRSGAKIKILSHNDKTTERKVMFLGTREQIKIAKDLIDNCVAQEKCRREIEQTKRSPRHFQPPSKSPSPTPSVTTSDNTEDAGDSQVHKHVKYKRPENRGAPIEVYVSAVSSPSRFWVQFVGPQVTQLDSLVEEMTEYYGKKENREAHALAHVSVGQVVAAVFRHDGRWYRARVHDIRPNEFDSTQLVADVFFLDYGDSEYVATHELCELRADLLRLRFQAMECFLAGVSPAMSAAGARDHWPQQAVDRFEELTQVARWKALMSKTCTYKKTASAEGEKEREIPGIKLFDNTDEGELDIGAALIEEGWAEPGPGDRPSPTPHRPPFGDLGNSRVLGMIEGERSSSVPKDHKDRGEQKPKTTDDSEKGKDNDRMTTSKSLGSGLETGDKPLSISNFDLSYPDNSLSKALNGSHQNFLHMEKQNLDKEGNIETGSLDTLVPPVSSTPNLSKSPLDELKANMNRIDSHHNLEFLERSQHENN